jgi:anti-sigma factor RsiW
MGHLHFKSNQTAARYVAGDLDGEEQSLFEMHFMSCGECLNDVETWRAMREGLRVAQTNSEAPSAQANSRPAPQRMRGEGWRLVAMLATVACIASVGGWWLRTVQGPALDDARVAFVTQPATLRGAACEALRISPAARIVALRVPGAVAGERLVVSDANGHELPAAHYFVQPQADSSWLVRFPAEVIIGHELRLLARSAADAHVAEPLGCVSGVAIP